MDLMYYEVFYSYFSNCFEKFSFMFLFLTFITSSMYATNLISNAFFLITVKTLHLSNLLIFKSVNEIIFFILASSYSCL